VVAPLPGRSVTRLCRVRMHQHRQRAPPDGQPGHEGAELRRGPEVHLELGDGEQALGHAVEGADMQLGDLFR
jgi:hypothetical protein